MKEPNEPKDRIICALDFKLPDVARQVAITMQPFVSAEFKIGPGLWARGGRSFLEDLRSATGSGIFLDLKYHDIPETVADAAEAAVELGVSSFTIHCDGGLAMMRAAREGVAAGVALPQVKAGGLARPRILGATMLTSKSAADLERDGLIRLNEDAPARAYDEVFDEIIMRRALLAKEAGLDGIVVSPRFVKHVRKACGPDFTIIVPGIHMVATAGQAIRDGADAVVVGRLFRQTKDPVGMARQIQAAIAAALGEVQS